MLLRHKRVAIIGAGPVGLTMARLLQQEGIDVTVYERDNDPLARIWGGTLDLQPETGQAALAMAGLLDRYFALATPMGRTLADQDGRVFFTKQPTPDSPEINRNDLRTILLDSLSSGTVVWGRKVSALDADNGTWRVRFEHGSDQTADIVLVANGGMSKVRACVTDTAVQATGSYIIQGEVTQPQFQCPAFFERCGGNIFMTAGAGRTLVVNPNNAGLLTYNVSFTSPNDWVHGCPLNFQHPEDVRHFLHGLFTSWDERYHELIGATSSFWGLPTGQLPLTPTWKPDRPAPITLIGDAAHLMPPFAGQGVNTGLKDALILGTNLTSGKFETLSAVIADYEAQMFSYAAAAQTQTRQNEQEMHRPDFTFEKRFNPHQPIN